MQAAVLPEARAAAAWNRWRSDVDFNAVDAASQRLLPLLARRPDVLGADPVRGRVRGIYRRTWVENGLLWERARPALAGLRDAGLPVVLTGAAALPPWFDGDEGARPMTAVDVVTGASATHVLHDLGLPRGPDGLHGGAIRVHGERPSRSHPADLLLDLIGDGPDLGWVVDAHWILPATDPGVLADAARRRGVLASLRQALETVADITGAASTEEALNAVRGRRRQLGETVRDALPAGRAARAAALVVAGGGLVLTVSDRLDLERSAQPGLTILHAALGRPPAVARAARRRGPLGRAPAPDGHVLRPGDVIDLTDPHVLDAYGATGWAGCSVLGAHAHGTEARLVLPALDGPCRVLLALAADHSAPLGVDVDERRAATTSGRGGACAVLLNLPATGRAVEVAVRSLRRPRALFVVMRSVTVLP